MLSKVFIISDYGNVDVRLQEVMIEKNICRYQLAQSVGVRFEVVNKWYKKEITKIDLDFLARFCFALDCKASDILVYIPNK